MKKPDGKAEAGWYDAPEIEGYLQYWNGKFWTKKKQIKDGYENLEVLPEFELGKFYFRKPFTSDNAFIGWAVINGLVAISRFSKNSKQGFDTSNAFSIYTGIADAVFGTFLFALFTWIFFLLYLIPRRNRDKKNSTANKIENEKVPVPQKFNFKSKKGVALGVILFILVASYLISRNSNNSFSAQGDKYFNIEQKISAVVGEWNVAATPISEAVQAISNGTMNAAQARQVAGEASSNFAVIHNKLFDECSAIPNYDLSAPNEEGAIAKAYDALKVTCDLLPQESIEILALVIEQISPIGTQERIDYHSNQITVIIEKRKKALLDSLEAIDPYVTDAQREAIKRLKATL
jgi:hypothetical protein